LWSGKEGTNDDREVTLMTEGPMSDELIEEIDVEPVPELDTPDEGELDPDDTYTEGVDGP
jgi:hypothetical protein